jgi:hypothetical protein
MKSKLFRLDNEEDEEEEGGYVKGGGGRRRSFEFITDIFRKADTPIIGSNLLYEGANDISQQVSPLTSFRMDIKRPSQKFVAADSDLTAAHLDLMAAHSELDDRDTDSDNDNDNDKDVQIIPAKDVYKGNNIEGGETNAADLEGEVYV